MHFSRRLTLVLLLVCALAFSGCSSKENQSFKTVNGQAIKGLITKGSVSAYQVSSQDQSLTLLSTSQTDLNGTFSLEIDPVAFKGPTLVQINAQTGTQMVCELIDGCTDSNDGHWYDYGEASPLPSNFQLLGLAVQSDDGTYQANISALSHLIVSTALNLPGGLTANNIEQSNAWVQEAFKLNQSPLKTSLTDITKLSSYTTLDEQSLIQSIVGASFYSLSQTQDWYDGKVSVHDIQQAEIYALASSLSSAITQTLGTNDAQYLDQLSSGQFNQNISALEIISQPQSTQTQEGDSFFFRAYAVSPKSTNYQWLYNGVEIPNATSAVFGLSHAARSNAGRYSVRITSGGSNILSNTALLSVSENNDAFISEHPVATSLVSGQALSLRINLSNSHNAKISWQKDGSLVVGQSSERLQINDAQANDSGNYRAIVEDQGAVLYSDFARVTVTEGLAPITIQSQPRTRDLLEGSNASLSVTATGGGYLRYQWYKNGNIISEATQASLQLGAANQSAEGHYHVEISNSVGSTRSDAAEIRIIDQSTELTLSAQPQSSSVYLGEDYTLGVASPLATDHQYQWFKDDVTINGATQSTYKITAVSEYDAGQYHATVSNILGSVTSDAAAIDVLPLPSLALSWAMPSERENGEPLNASEIYGYKLAYGYSHNDAPFQHDIVGAFSTHFTLQALKPGTVFLRIATIDSDGVTGRFSSPIEVQLH